MAEIEQYDIVSAISGLATEVRNYKKNRHKNEWNWSCLVCGDSLTNRRKARFGVGFKKGVALCHCFNCGYSNTFISYIKQYHPHVYNDLMKLQFEKNISPSYDLNHLVDLPNHISTHLFYIDKYKSKKKWLTRLIDEKMSLNRDTLNKLDQKHESYWNASNSKKG